MLTMLPWLFVAVSAQDPPSALQASVSWKSIAAEGVSAIYPGPGGNLYCVREANLGSVRTIRYDGGTVSSVELPEGYRVFGTGPKDEIFLGRPWPSGYFVDGKVVPIGPMPSVNDELSYGRWYSYWNFEGLCVSWDGGTEVLFRNVPIEARIASDPDGHAMYALIAGKGISVLEIHGLKSQRISSKKVGIPIAVSNRDFELSASASGGRVVFMTSAPPGNSQSVPLIEPADQRPVRDADLLTSYVVCYDLKARHSWVLGRFEEWLFPAALGRAGVRPRNRLVLRGDTLAILHRRNLWIGRLDQEGSL